MCVKEKEGKRFRERNRPKKQQKKENMKLKPASSLATECKCCTLPAKTCIQTHSHMNIKFLHCILCGDRLAHQQLFGTVLLQQCAIAVR